LGILFCVAPEGFGKKAQKMEKDFSVKPKYYFVCQQLLKDGDKISDALQRERPLPRRLRCLLRTYYPGMLVALALPAGLEASSEMRHLFPFRL
jgi:hypothetical protein